MSHPATWPNAFFYPIGNTPPVCLTQDLPPNIPADILLLGCGDPRSILYTCFADLGAPRRKIDATCCDIEPAVLARNVLLLTLLADDESAALSSNIWEIFYHFYLDKPSLDILSDQCQKLIDLTKSLDVWNQSKYGAFLRFCTHTTLSELRGYWERYLGADRLSVRGKRRLRTQFQNGMNTAAAKVSEDNLMYAACRSAVPLWQEIGKVAPNHYKSYWKSGVMCTSSAASSSPLPYVNPTFVHSSKGHIFNVHYGTDPILSFHLAATMPAVSGNADRPTTAETVVIGAKLQFEGWSNAFRRSLAQSSLTVRFFTGDAIHFCHALRFLSRTGHHTTDIHISVWRGEKITFDEADYDITVPSAAPIIFNVIDTSNLTDHVGLLNVLCAAIPLLRHDHLSMLQTESLTPLEADPQDDFKENLCMPPSTFALLTGVIPVGYLSRFSSRFVMHGIACASLIAPASISRQSLSWRRPDFDGGDDQKQRLSIEAHTLSDLLFKFYLKLFAVEAGRDLMRNMTPGNIKRANVAHYVRRNYVWLLALIKDRVYTDWPRAMEMLMDRIQDDKQLHMGMNYFQDLCSEMHQQKIFTVEYLLHSDRYTSRTGVFRRWQTIPAVVCLMVEIPASKLKPLKDHGGSAGTTLLQCDVTTGNVMHTALCTPQFTFGNVNTTPSGISIREDPLGPFGTSPLVMYTWISAWLLSVDPAATVIKFCIRSTVATEIWQCWIPSLEVDMALYRVPLLDERHVFVVRDWPQLADASFRPSVGPGSDEADSVSLMNPVLSIRGGVPYLTARVNIDVEGSPVRAPAVSMTQRSPCRVEINAADNEQRSIPFPFPVDVSRASLHQSPSTVEVQAPLSEPSVLNSFSFNRFPIVLLSSTPWLWNIPYINLDSMPVINVANSDSLKWLDSHLAFMLSDRERLAFRQTGHVSDTLHCLKKSLTQIFLTFTGVYKPKAKIFALRTSEGGIFTLLFVRELRLDLDSQTIVADCFLLPIPFGIECPSAPLKVERILKNRAVMEINTAPSEQRTWMQLFSVISERCRKWEHTPNCDYKTRGTLWSLDATIPPVFCSCGQGKDDASSFFKDMGIDDVSCFVTRAALGPLFAVPYLEDVGVTAIDTAQNSGTSSKCASCGAQSEHLQVCSACKRQYYCSRACQRSDWKRHKPNCRAV